MIDYWHGQRVHLRALKLSDSDFSLGLSRDIERGQFIDWLRPPTSKEAVEYWLQEKIKQGMKNFGHQWMIDSTDGETIGSIVTHTCDSRVGTFSYALDIARDSQRQGFATESIKLILAYYFLELRFQKVTIAAASHNEASIALHKKLGFRHEGAHRRMVFSNGNYYDLEWFGLTFEEFSHLN